MAYTKTESHTKAVDIVKIALQSGSIKLIGSNPMAQNATNNGASDAAYLKKLIEDLSTYIQAT